MGAWVEAMEEERYSHAYRTAVELLVVGLPVADSLDLSDLGCGMDKWREQHPTELLEGLVGFVLSVSIAAVNRRDDADAPPSSGPPTR
jgi:hypothetical protein